MKIKWEPVNRIYNLWVHGLPDISHTEKRFHCPFTIRRCIGITLPVNHQKIHFRHIHHFRLFGRTVIKVPEFLFLFMI